MSEVVLQFSDQIHHFASEKPKGSILSAFVGRLMLTDQRLLFLSTAKSGAAKQVLAVLFGSVVFGKTTTHDLDLAAADDEGGINVPLDRIAKCEVRGSWYSIPHLAIEFKAGHGKPLASCFVIKGGMRKAPFIGWKSAIDGALAKMSS